MISPFIPLFSPFRGPPLKLYSFPLLLLHPFYILFIQLQLFPLSSTLLSFITHHTLFFHLTPLFHFSPSPYSTLPLPLYSPTPSPLSHLTPLIPRHLPLFHFSPSLYPISPLPSILHHPFSCTPHHSPLFHLTSYSISLHPLIPNHPFPFIPLTPSLYTMSPLPFIPHHPLLFRSSSPPLSPSAPARASQLTNKISNKINTHTVCHEYAAVTIQMFIND